MDIRTIFANMSWLATSQIITSILAFFWTIFTARYLGVNDYGILGFVVSLSAMFAIISDLGQSTHIVRSVSVDYSKARDYLGNAIPFKSLLSVVYILVILFVLLITDSSEITILIGLLFAFESVIKNFCSLFYGVFQAHEKGSYQAIANTILNVLTFVFIILAIYLDAGLWGITWAYIFANVACIVYTVYILCKHFEVPKIQFDFGFWKQLAIFGFPFALTTIFYTIYYSIDIFMLNQLIGDFATGIYNATYKLINVLTLFYSIYTAVFFPVMSKLYAKEKSMLKTTLSKSIKYLSLITVPIAIWVMIYSPDIIQFIYGNQYAQASIVLNVLIWTVVFLFINGAASNSLNASHKEYSVTKIYVIAAVFNVILNLILIPRYSYIGASVATVLSEILIFVLEIYALHKLNLSPNKGLILDTLKIVVASIVMGSALYFAHLSMWVTIPVAIIVYLVVGFVIKMFDNDDIYVIKQIIGR